MRAVAFVLIGAMGTLFGGEFGVRLWRARHRHPGKSGVSVIIDGADSMAGPASSPDRSSSGSTCRLPAIPMWAASPTAPISTIPDLRRGGGADLAPRAPHPALVAPL